MSRRKCVKLVTYNFLFGADYAPVKYAALSYGISQCPDSGIYCLMGDVGNFVNLILKDQVSVL